MTRNTGRPDDGAPGKTGSIRTPRLAGKVALVTGIGSGIGRGCALAFAREGASVFGCDLDPAAAEQCLAAAAAEGLSIDSWHPCDLTIDAQCRTLLERVHARHGQLDILVNAAAIAPRLASIATLEEHDWIATMKGEVDLVYLLTRHAWPHLMASGAGSIVNFASVNAFRGSRLFGMAAHCAGKGAVLALTRQMAVEGGPYNLRANSISPAIIASDATAAAGALEPGETRERLLSRMLIKRLGTPEDVAACAIFLASDEAGWITGADIPVDGGVMAN